MSGTLLLHIIADTCLPDYFFLTSKHFYPNFKFIMSSNHSFKNPFPA